MAEKNWWDEYPDASEVPVGTTQPGGPAERAAVPVDKYRQAAIEDRNKLVAAGANLPEGYTDRAARGAGLGWADELVAGATVPLEMIKRGTWSPAEAYRYNKAALDLRNQKTDENTAGAGGVAADLAGGLAGGAGAFGRQATAKTIPYLNKTISAPVVNYGKTVATGAGLGGIYGAGEAPDIASIPGGAAVGAAIGGGVGAALPAVAATLGAGARALQVPRLRDPEKIATEQVAKTVRDSGQPIEEIVQRVRDAHAAGQTDYTIADAIGHAGERKLTGLAKVPGPAREQITELLTNRGLEMPQRVGGEVGRALDAPGTAAAATERLIDLAGRKAGPLYRQAEQVGPVWNDAIKDIISDPIAKAGLRRGVEIQRIEAAGTGRAAQPTDTAIVGFNEAFEPIAGQVPNMRTLQALKVGLDDIIESSINPATGRLNAHGRAVTGFKNRLLENIDAMNPVYREARAAYAGPMSVKDAVRTGQDMVTRGRPADTLHEFRGLSPTEQQGVRVGVADKVQEQLERAGNFPAYLRAKSPKGSQELEALSLYQGPRQPGQPDQLRQFLNREEQMQRTSNAARGGSSTAENLADINAQPGAGEMLGLAGNVASGRLLAAAQGALGMAGRFAKGENEAQRTAIARALMTRDPAMAEQLANRIGAHELRRRGINPWTGRARIGP
jgi:hypothetical protein